MKKQNNPFKKNKEEIIYNLINSALAGALVFLGSLSTGEITFKGFYFALIGAGIILITNLKIIGTAKKKNIKKVSLIFYNEKRKRKQQRQR